MAALEIAERRLGPVTIVELRGRLVADDGVTSFTNRITALLGFGHRNLLVDFGRVTYIDSGGVGALVSMFLRVARRGGRLKLVRPSVRVLRVLQMTRLVDVFEVFDDEESALQSFARPSALPDLARRATAVMERT
jgi:anti-sigma B factor antagonist